MSYDKARAKEPFKPVAIPDLFCAWIGKLTITWSDFEINFDEFLRLLVKAQNHPKKWEKLNFKKRKNLFRDLTAREFGRIPEIATYIRQLLNMSGDLHWKRNFIVHGKMHAMTHTKFLEDATPPKIHVEHVLKMDGYHNGRPTTLSYKEGGVEDLFYQIGHLNGLLLSLLSAAESLPFSSENKSVLQAFLDRNR